MAVSLDNKGFDGFFIDNTDVYYQYQTDEVYMGIMDILTKLKGLDKDIVINGGDTFMRRYIESGDGRTRLIHGVNQEDVYTTYDFDNKKYLTNSADERKYYTEYLQDLSASGYMVYVLEYADDEDVQEEAYKYSRSQSFTCYVSDNIELKINSGE